MKPLVKLLVVLSASMLVLATALALIDIRILAIDPVLMSYGSINLLVVARAIGGVSHWTLLTRRPPPKGFVANPWNQAAQVICGLALVAFLFSAIALVFKTAVFGRLHFGWSLVSFNLAILAIVISEMLFDRRQ